MGLAAGGRPWKKGGFFIHGPYVAILVLFLNQVERFHIPPGG